MDNLTETPQNPIVGMMASALRKGKEALNYPGKLPESIPLLGGMGAGDVLFGKGPELMEDMSYGSPPYRGKGFATQVDPRTVDLAFAPGVGSMTSMALRGGKAAVPAMANTVTDMSRREFMKKAGALAAGGTVAATAPDMLVKALREAPVLAKEAVPVMVKEAAPAVAAQAVRAWTPELIKSGIGRATQHLVGESLEDTPELSKHFLKKFKTPDEYDNYMKVWDFEPGKTYAGLDDVQREARDDYLAALDENFDYNKIEKAVKTGVIPKSWAQKMPGKVPPTMDDLMEKMAEYHMDPSGLFDQERPDFFSRSFEHFYQ